jgi:hypothetical protein
MLRIAVTSSVRSIPALPAHRRCSVTVALHQGVASQRLRRNTPVTALLIEGCIDASRVEIVDIRSAPATWYSERSLRADAFGVDRGVQTKSKN